MKTNEDLELLYFSSFKAISSLLNSDNYTEEDIIKIISILSYNQENSFFEENNYDLDSVSNIFRFYEDELKDSFEKDKSRFTILFDNYLLIIELFTILCDLLSYDKERRHLINPIFQILKESKNLVKLFVPLEPRELKILNNIIGEQLYYFSHIQYIGTKDKSIDYIFEQYLLECEKMFHGFELSALSNFGGNPYKSEKVEKMIFINNLAFLLLKMIHKLNFYRTESDIFDNRYFYKIIEFFIAVCISKNDKDITDEKLFHKLLFEQFNISANYLKNEKNYDIISKKLRILSLNTDEYKELIDIIMSSK